MVANPGAFPNIWDVSRPNFFQEIELQVLSGKLFCAYCCIKPPMNFEILLGFWEDLRDENKVLVRSRRISASETCSRGFWTVNNGKWVYLSTISKNITNMIYSRGVREIKLPCWCNFSTLLIIDEKSSNSSLSAWFFPAPYTKIFKLPKSKIRTNNLSTVEDSKEWICIPITESLKAR